MVDQDQRVLPAEPASHAQGYAAMPMCLRHVEEILVLVRGAGVGSSLLPCNASDGLHLRGKKGCDVQNMVCTVIIRVGGDALWGHLAKGIFTPHTMFEMKIIIILLQIISLILMSSITGTFCNTPSFKTLFSY